MLTWSARWLRERFEAHDKRDQDMTFWWQLPEDESRTRSRSPWRQLLTDLTSQATFSQWHLRVTKTRVEKYDRLRPAVTRALALMAVAVAIATVGSPWWVRLMLAPALAQVTLELASHPYLAKSAPQPRSRLIVLTRDVFRATFGRYFFNLTGAIGAIACPLNIVAVSLAQPGGEFGWVKVGALAAAIFYLNSGLGGVFLDPSNYTEASGMPSWLHATRPYVPLISFAVVTTIVAWGVAWDRWGRPMIPVAYLCAALTLLLGSTIRNHDRMIAAAVPPARAAIEEGREELGRIIHDQLSPIKAAAEGAAQVKAVPVKWATDLASLPALLTHFHTRTGIFDSRRMSLEYLANRVLEPYGIWEHITYELTWGELSDGDHQLAVTMTTALLHNVAQALTEPDNGAYPKDIVLEGYVTGEDRDKYYHLAVRDCLPLIEDWCPPGRSMNELRTMLRTDHGGELTQEALGSGKKRIIASWADVTTPDEYGDPFGSEE